MPRHKTMNQMGTMIITLTLNDTNITDSNINIIGIKQTLSYKNTQQNSQDKMAKTLCKVQQQRPTDSYIADLKTCTGHNLEECNTWLL